MPQWEFPGGKSVAVVTSWDNGPQTDRMLHRMLEQYGYKGTFYVAPEEIGTAGHLDQAALRQILADGHEIGVLGANLHSAEEALPPAEWERRLHERKLRVEAMFGAPVTAFAYPPGLAQELDKIAEAARKAGYTSARTTESIDAMTAEMLTHIDRMRLPVTAHLSESFLDIQSKWEAVEESDGGIFHLWGCSQPLGEDPQDWVDFECILGFLGGISHVWYSTVGELITTIHANAGR